METLTRMRYGREITGEDLRLQHKLVYIQKYSEALLNRPNLKQDEICQMTGINKHTLRRYMKELGIASFYKHDLTIPRKKQKASISTKKLQAKDPKRVSSTLESANAKLFQRGGNVSPIVISEVDKAPIIDYSSFFNNNKPHKVLSERTLNRVKDIRNK